MKNVKLLESLKFPKSCRTNAVSKVKKQKTHQATNRLNPRFYLPTQL